MTYDEQYSKLQKEYTIAAQQYHKLPTDTQVVRNWHKALQNLLAYFSKFRGKKIQGNQEMGLE